MSETSPPNLTRAILLENALPQGERVSFLLGAESLSPEGRRVVSGEVLGYTVRGDTADIVLNRITTWMYDTAPSFLEAVDPQYEGVFRLKLLCDDFDTPKVRETLEELRNPSRPGRCALAASEVPFSRCPNTICSREGFPAWSRFCPDCGTRVSLGENRPPVMSPPSEGLDYCPACWVVPPTPGAFCKDCGYDRTLPEQIGALARTTAHFQLTGGRYRRGAFRARILMGRYMRIWVEGPRLYLKVAQVEWEGRAPFDAPPEGFTTMLSVHLPGGNVRAALEDVAAGKTLRVQEILWRCGYCRHHLGWTAWSLGEKQPSRRAPMPRGAYCTTCGTRCRLLPHPQHTISRKPVQHRGGRFHTCGALLGSADAYCGGCGDMIEHADQAFGERLSGIGDSPDLSNLPSLSDLEAVLEEEWMDPGLRSFKDMPFS